MSKVTPASVSYVAESGGKEQQIDFHAVIMEEHETTAQVTKYPVQTGKHISNNSIRNNRVITLTGAISNIRWTDIQGNVISGRDYGENATSIVKAAFDALVLSGTHCKVVTNLGIYDPVVFDKSKTSQKAGMVDSMNITVRGQEVIAVNSENYVAPVPVTFTEVTGPARDALVSDLESSGVIVDSEQKVSQGTYNTDESFVISARDSADKPVETTYEFVCFDPTTGQPSYNVHATGLEVSTGEGTTITPNSCAERGFLRSLSSGIQQVPGCLVGAVKDVVTDLVEETVETALGELTKSAYGMFYDTVTMDNKAGQALATAGLGCIIRGVTNTDDTFPFKPGESLPTVEQVMSGNLLGGNTKRETLTKIECTKPAPIREAVATRELPI